MINYTRADRASEGAVLLIDGRTFVVSEMEFLNDNANVVLRGKAQGIGDTFIICPDDTEIEIVSN
jgi:hypothetical protein